MPDLNEIAVFARIVAKGSFAAAAKDFGVPPSTLSRKLASLERRLGVALLTRTTRSLRLTDVGREYAEKCAEIMGRVEEADQAVMRLTQAPRGTLRITAPRVFVHTLLAPTMAEYLKRYSDVRMEITTEDRTVDLLREGYDLAFRVAPALPDTTLIARKLAGTVHDLCAAPSYLAQHPAPKRPGDLVEHSIFAFGRDRKTVTWTFAHGRREAERVTLTPRVLSASEEILLDLAIRGLGVALLPPGVADTEIARGRVQRLLPNYEIEPRNVYLIMPPEKQNSPLVRPYVEIVEATLRNAPGLLRQYGMP